MIRRFTTLAAAAALAVVPLAALAEVSAGTELSGTLAKNFSA